MHALESTPVFPGIEREGEVEERAKMSCISKSTVKRSIYTLLQHVKTRSTCAQCDVGTQSPVIHKRDMSLFWSTRSGCRVILRK